jgi:hypothetical protein
MIAIFFSCKKISHETVHENHVVSGNTIPNYSGVSTIQVHAYLNRIYIDLLGREADSAELVAKTNYLITNNFSANARDTIISQAIKDIQFFPQFFIKTSSVVLNSTSKNDVYNEIIQYQYFETFDLQNHDTISANNDVVELDKLNKLYQSDSLLHLNQIDISEFYRRFIYNYFYDQINMGTENYVKSCFENLFHRDPTSAELSTSENMVNGMSSYTLFLQTGNCKGDFANITTHCTEFYQGLIITAYQNYLQRKPTDAEINSLINPLAQSKNYWNVMKTIMKTSEYAGF